MRKKYLHKKLFDLLQNINNNIKMIVSHTQTYEKKKYKRTEVKIVIRSKNLKVRKPRIITIA